VTVILMGVRAHGGTGMRRHQAVLAMKDFRRLWLGITTSALHGGAFAALRALMRATPPLGVAVVTPLLARGDLTVAALAMALIAGLPGAATIIGGHPAGPRDYPGGENGRRGP